MKEEYLKYLLKQYNGYLRSIVLEQAFEPVPVAIGPLPQTTRELYQRIEAFQQYEKKEGGNGWVIEWKDWSSKKLGKQRWPEKITVSTEGDLFFLLNKQEEVNTFRQQLQLMIDWNGNIRSWLAAQPRRVLDWKNSWPGISAVLEYLMTNDVCEHYIRSLPVPVHTKFISEHESVILSLLKHLAPEKVQADVTKLSTALGLQQKPFIYPMRWLDPILAAKYTHNMEVLGVTPEGLKQLSWEVDAIVLVENETNLYLMPEVKETMAICSWGKALSLLREVPLLQQTRLFYWGDLDDEGFRMLNNVRQHYPHVKSLLMDQATVDFHLKELKSQDMPYHTATLNLLFPNEQSAYETLAATQGRIEQEQLQQQYIQHALQNAIQLP